MWDVGPQTMSLWLPTISFFSRLTILRQEGGPSKISEHAFENIFKYSLRNVSTNNRKKPYSLLQIKVADRIILING